MATKPSGLTLGGILFQQASTTREAERYKIHPGLNQGRRKEKEKGKGLGNSCSTHPKMRAGGWQREMSDNSTWSSWASPVTENFSFRNSFESDGYNYFGSFGYRGFCPSIFQGL